MRRTTEPPPGLNVWDEPQDSPADTFSALPGRHMRRSLPPKRFSLYSFDYGKSEAVKSAEGRNEQESARSGASPARARASALASALRIRNHGPRAPAFSYHRTL